MCIACELGFWIAMDDLPNHPPPGFPGAPPPDDAARFACDAPGESAKAPAPKDEPTP